MYLNMLSVAENLTFYSEKFTPGSSEAVNKVLTYGLPFSLFGFATVFCVLALLMFMVIIFGKVFGAAAPKKKERENTEKKPEVKVESTPVAAPAPVADNGSVVAAIMAAISAFRASNGEGGSFRVVSFKKRK